MNRKVNRPILGFVACIALLGCATAQAMDADHAVEAPMPKAMATVLDPESIYQVESRWTRSDGEEIELSSLRGRVRVVAIFYATCEYACPVIVGRMKSAQATLPEGIRDQVGFVLISMDAAHDDPKRLAEYAKRMELKGDWTLLHGSDEDVRELAAVIGFRYRQEKDGGFAHSNMVTVLDQEGKVVHQSLGLDSDATDTVSAVTALLVPEAAKEDAK